MLNLDFRGIFGDRLADLNDFKKVNEVYAKCECTLHIKSYILTFLILHTVSIHNVFFRFGYVSFTPSVQQYLLMLLLLLLLLELNFEKIVGFQISLHQHLLVQRTRLQHYRWMQGLRLNA